ncbi:Oidioi.mRNA.OKI2018_I69.chr1.g869.t1.cds [Oikopleura dioica]|uniref:Oidioi.mRNA.OKI2018_I69.chr1.g869.t1.cds n=1 Tax=Oikopleura dioica TaxID=34765 RepID=A0ABN7SQ21_OIKDI|nr:Oidioi.mRNA.OKI2018_I69.chr1.g869.t1.cds [Oikopleura dioica]
MFSSLFETRETSNNLLGAHVNITQCSNDIKIAVPAFNDGQYFCAGSSPGVEDSMRVDSCQGDSGGAIVCMEEIEYEGKAKNVPVQYGLVSSGKSCGESAGVYAKTSTIVNTILKKIYTNTYAPEMDPRGVIPTMDEDEDSDYSYYGY